MDLKVNILDANAENLTEQEILKRINSVNPKLICLVVYGRNVNAGTTNMSGAIHTIDYLKRFYKYSNINNWIHVQALPRETLKMKKV